MFILLGLLFAEPRTLRYLSDIRTTLNTSEIILAWEKRTFCGNFFSRVCLHRHKMVFWQFREVTQRVLNGTAGRANISFFIEQTINCLYLLPISSKDKAFFSDVVTTRLYKLGNNKAQEFLTLEVRWWHQTDRAHKSRREERLSANELSRFCFLSLCKYIRKLNFANKHNNNNMLGDVH